MRTASSAVCPSRQRTGLVSKRKCDVVVNDPGVSGLYTFRPLRFVRKGIAFEQSPSYLCAPQSRLFVRVAVETDIDEGGLHTGEHAGDAAFVDATDQRELFFALDINFD